jgi:hypothetical protein
VCSPCTSAAKGKSNLPLCSCFPKTARRVATKCVRTEAVPAAAQQQDAGRRLRPHGARTAAGTLIVTATERAKDRETGRDHGGRGAGMICSPHCTAASLAATACVSLRGRLFFGTYNCYNCRLAPLGAWRRQPDAATRPAVVLQVLSSGNAAGRRCHGPRHVLWIHPRNDNV